MRVGFFGVLGSGNWGNDASLEVVHAFLRGRDPDIRFGFMAMGPGRLENRYDAPAVHLQWYEANMDRLAWLPDVLLKVVGRLLDPVRILAWVRELDVVIVPGMGVFETTTPQRPWGMPYNLLMLGLAARAAGARVAYVSVGANFTRDRPTRWVLARAARLAHYRSFRDELSRDSMREMGINVRGDRVYPDLAFAMTVPPVRSNGGRRLGVGVMNYVGGSEDRPRAAQIHDAYVSAMKRFVGMLVDEGWQVRLFTGDVEDEVVLREIMDATIGGRPPGSVSVGADLVGSLPELMEVMADVDAVVASRFHNVLGSLKLSLPTLSISYARKNDVLMTSMGMGEFCHPAGEIDFDRLVEQFRSLACHREQLVEEMTALNLVHAGGVDRQLDDLAEFMSGRP